MMIYKAQKCKFIARSCIEAEGIWAYSRKWDMCILLSTICYKYIMYAAFFLGNIEETDDDKEHLMQF